MRRTLPRLLALALLFTGLAVTPVAAQDQVAGGVGGTATLLPAALTSTVLFPTPLAPRAAESVTPSQTVVAGQSFPGSRRPAALPALYASTALLQALDAHSTMKALSGGAREANPLMKGVAGNPGALLAVKAGVTGATIYFAEKMWKRNPVGAVAMMVVVNSVNAFVVAHNYKVARSLR